MPVLIGILMLFGIVAKNSILLLDFAIEEMAKGVPKNEAIIDAGHKRAQPIVMTTMAMVAGMVPTALALEGDASWRAPMGVVVIGGLLLSTLLTLVLVPASFSLADSFEKWLGAEVPPLVITYRRQAGPRPASRAASRRSKALTGGGYPPGPPPVIHAPMSLLPSPGRTPAQRDARGMRALATAMLAGMAAIFIAVTNLADAHPAWGFVRAFAEAAWSAASPTGSRSPLCSATRSACRSRTPRSSRATRTGSATRSPPSCRTISSPPRWSRGGCAARRRRRGRPLPRPAAAARGGCARAARALLADILEALDRSSSAAW